MTHGIVMTSGDQRLPNGRRADGELPPPRVKDVELDPRDQKLAVYLEHRMLSIIRRETRDPYGGLPADDVLDRLDRRFPNVNFPERMMARLEQEQESRHARLARAQELEKYEAETRRTAIEQDRELQRHSARRAERVLYVLVVVGLLLVFTGHEDVGKIVLGTTLVGVIGAFVAHRVRREN